jgi:hypothetical protein
MPDGRVKNGGRREGAGRKSKKHEFQDDGKLTPLQFFLSILRDEAAPRSDRVEAAKAALPYCSARLQSTVLDASGDINVQLVSYLGNNDTDTADNA